ncbi:hypothetical protein [Arthrobacter sp. BPSS-3]|uniref:hypothetical protein n=1 Tax=Arthrobacter sp. BPSS-3 TaxID=3366580 RepID=UPI0037DD5543
MRNLVAVAFVEPVSAGQVFARDAWPLHITLVRFDVADPPAEAKDDDGGYLAPASGAAPSASCPVNPETGPTDPGPLEADSLVSDPLETEIARRMDPIVRAALGEVLTAGEPANFGRNGSIPVTLIEPNERLQQLHEGLLDIVESLHGRVATGAYTRSGYRPHVSHQGAKLLKTGDRLVLDRVALVDMAPGGTHSSRKVLTLWDATL